MEIALNKGELLNILAEKYRVGIVGYWFDIKNGNIIAKIKLGEDVYVEEVAIEEIVKKSSILQKAKNEYDDFCKKIIENYALKKLAIKLIAEKEQNK